MRTLLLSFSLNILLVAIPQICTGQTVRQTADEMRQRLVSEYPVLAGDHGMEHYSEIQENKRRIREIYAVIEREDSLLVPFDRATLDEADRLTEKLPGRFQYTLYAASLYDLLRAECYDQSIWPDSRRKELFDLLIDLAERLYAVAFEIAGSADELAVSASSLAEIRIRDEYYCYDNMPLYKECYEMTDNNNYRFGILERIIGYLSDYKDPVPDEKIKAVLPYKKKLADLVTGISGFTPDYKADVIRDCARYCRLAQDEDADYYFNKAASLEETSAMPYGIKRLARIIDRNEYAQDPAVNSALSCDDYTAAMNAMKSLEMICDENDFYSQEDIYGKIPSYGRLYQFIETYPIHIATLAKIKSRFGKDDADKYRTEAFLSAAQILIHAKIASSPERAESQLRFLTPAITLQYGNTDPGQAYNAALFLKHMLSREYGRLYQYCDIQSCLRENEYAVEFVNYYDDRTGKEQYDALILSKGSPCPTRVRICDGNDLLLLYATGQSIYQSGLYGFIWSKLEKEIPKGATLSFAPSGLINIINIEAAQNKAGRRASDIWNIRRLTSTKQLCLPHPANRSFSQAAILGGTDDLAHTRHEADEITALMTSEDIQTKTFVGKKCTENNLKKCVNASPDILHIAAHAFFLDNDAIPSPLQSGLLLSGGKKVELGKTAPGNYEDNIVFSKDIAEMPLDCCRLAVLSACETGLGYISADGVSGLQQAFKQAGVQTIVVSLWKVNDMTTSRLMTAFYCNLLSGMDAHSAMYAAQDHIRKIPEYSHPYYWAGFIVLD